MRRSEEGGRNEEESWARSQEGGRSAPKVHFMDLFPGNTLFPHYSIPVLSTGGDLCSPREHAFAGGEYWYAGGGEVGEPGGLFREGTL